MLFTSLSGDAAQRTVFKNATLQDLQETVCSLFGKPSTRASLVVCEHVYSELSSRPFRYCSKIRPVEARVIFASGLHAVLRTAYGESHEVAVEPGTSLRDLQRVLCKLFRQRFPAMKATLMVENEVYDEFIQIPFKNRVGTVEAAVKFAPTDDPFFYDLRDRKPQKKTPSGLVELAPLCLR